MRRRKPQPPPPAAVTGQLLLRRLPYGVLVEFCQLLDPKSALNMDWTGVASRIKRKNGSDRYTQNHVRMLAREQSPTMALINDWSTTNVTVQDLVDILDDMEMQSAIDILLPPEEEIEEKREVFPGEVVHQGDAYVSLTPHEDKAAVTPEPSLSSEAQPSSRPQGQWSSSGDVVSSTTNKEPCESDFSEPVQQSDLPSMPLLSDPVQEYKYRDLAEMTNRFDELPVCKGGNRIGEGGFGTVFKGAFGGNNQFCAVKRLKMDILDDQTVRKQFIAEHTTLSKLQHTNLVQLYGYSFDGPSYCLVFQYLVNGSLNDRLACEDDTAPLDWRTRVNIMQGAATGICFLHQYGHIHRDIKSANILLDENFVAKIGDFGLTKVMSDEATHMMTTTNYGTAVYMAPEALGGEISTKGDAYSFGVVLLEIMTGSPAICNSDVRENPDIITHVKYKTEEEQTEFIKLMDSRMEHNFGEESVRKMYECATKLLEPVKQKRPELKEVLDTLMKC
ncbi:interleukin-1 receptor-associated kinase 4-like [Amphiura filiformis]|uniref:interleukin-1 receptor-associated kinase 4-like n=1 Tax=Amphiura filiformis TaxID=82378 RepID=UPI003B2207FA